MGKLKVNKGIFEGLKKAEKTFDYGLGSVLRVRISNDEFVNEILAPLNSLTVDEAYQIYKYGYELEQTPEEKLLEVFKEENLNDCDRGVNIGIRCALEILGIKIKGINE